MSCMSSGARSVQARASPRGYVMAETTAVKSFGGIYAGTFEASLNLRFGKAGVAKTAEALRKFESLHGQYKFGNWAQSLMPAQQDWSTDGKTEGYDNWQRNAMTVPDVLAQQITDAIRYCLITSNPPRPMFFKIGDNLDDTHDLVIKPYVYDGTEYVAVRLLCPNPNHPI
jgi:hypothetical protein